MDKNAIKKYAVWARNELIARVTQRAEQYETTEKNITPADADSIGGKVLTATEKKQRQALIAKINRDGYEQVMEEVAYTWFNRFTALRFMEVNGYLPSHVRVFTNDEGEFKPQILSEAIHLDLDGLNMEKVYELKNANKDEELFKYLLIVQCNALNKILPGMFQRIEDYTELLLPDYLLREGSTIQQMIELIPEQDWTDQVQIIGWLYQYYNTEPKDKVFADLKMNIKICKENIPAATQLFTPDWIVRYMVENSLGRLWLEGHPNDTVKSEWKYYLDEAEQESEVQKQLDAIHKEYAALKPEEIRCIDPCMGSGHILCYMFDVLVKIYEDYGHTAHEAATSIIENNLWGLDIDERAAQLSYFAVMMKARQYDRRFLNKKDENGNLAIPQPHVYAIEESNGITSAPMHDMGLNLTEEEYGEAVKQAMRLVDEMHDAKEYGSIIHVTLCDWNLLRRFAVPRDEDGQMHLDIHGEIEASTRLQALINVGEVLAQRYDIVVTNPPYIGSPNMGNGLLEYIKNNYTDSKADLYAAFIERNFAFSKRYVSMITQSTWMFQSRFEKARENLYEKLLVCMNHLGTRAFDEISGEVVQTTAFCYMNSKYLVNYKTQFVKLTDFYGEIAKENAFFDSANKNARDVGKFKTIPGAPFAHYISDEAIADFGRGTTLKDSLMPKQGTSTGDDETFIRYWFEPYYTKIGFDYASTKSAHESGLTFFPIDKGGEYRKWYGNNDRVIRFDSISYDKLLDMGNHLPSRQYYFQEGLTWSKIASELSVRFSQPGFVFSSVGLKGFPLKNKINYILAFMNSSVCRYFVKVISPGMSIVSGDIEKLPLIYEPQKEIDIICAENIKISQVDWDSFEVSWDFQSHPLAPMAYERQEQLSAGMNSEERKKAVTLLSERYRRWEQECEYRFSALKKNEEELNRIFIEIYGLQDELTPEVEDKDVTVRLADLQRDIRSLLSYAVGCIFGRYSLDVPGLVYAGGTWEASKYTTFQPDKDAIIPICDDEYFDDDIVGRFVKFIEVVYGKETLEENLKFIADALGGKGTSREVIRNYFMNDFYADHLKAYQKRPIYWLFDSGKKNGFKCLVYMHRYQPDTIARIRTDYVHEQQARYRTAIEEIEKRLDTASQSEKVKFTKKLNSLRDQDEELHAYEEKIHHLADQMISIDLDDGVKHNYALFQDVLAKIK